MELVDKILLAVIVAFSLVNQLIFSNFKSRLLKDIRYILQILFFLLAGYLFAKMNFFIASNSAAWYAMLMLIIIFLMYVYQLIRTIRFLKKLYIEYKPEYIFLLLKNILSIIIIFAILYNLIYSYDNSSFLKIRNDSALNTYIDFIYFSFLTFTNIGFKDIAISSFAKITVIIEIAIFYITIGAGVKFFIHQRNKSRDIPTEKN